MQDERQALLLLDEMHETLRQRRSGFQNGSAELTPTEVEFVQQLSAKLESAHQLQRRFQATGQKLHMQLAWKQYRALFHEISKRLERTKSCSMASVSPQLQRHGPMQLAMPATYKPFQPVESITGFDDKLTVLSSKQRPRKILICSSTGVQRPFLLKGNEDLRQDERVMQLLRLVNTLLGRHTHSQQLQMTMAVSGTVCSAACSDAGLAGWPLDPSLRHSSSLNRYRTG